MPACRELEQDALPARHDRAQLPSEPPAGARCQRGAAGEHRLSALRLLFNAVPQCPAGLVPGGGQFNIGFGKAMSRQRLKRQIESATAPVDRRILQKVDQLKGAADLIRQGSVLIGELSGKCQDQLADRIGRSAAVIEQGGEISVAACSHVLAKGRQQCFKSAPVELVGGDMRHQSGDPDRLRGIACAGKPDIGLERTQCSEPSFVARIAFVGDVVGMAGETVDCNDRRAQSSRHQPGRYREVFVVFDTVQGGGHAGL